jgi:hypothetical protein
MSAELPPTEETFAVKPADSLHAAGRRIEYLRSVRVVFEHPQWFQGLLLLALFMLIPVLSSPMLFGYLFEVTEHLHLRRSGPYPLFDVRRFAAYVTRGIWCYLIVNLIAANVIPIMVFFFDGSMIASMAIIQADRNVGGLVVAIGVPIVLTIFFALVLLLSVVLTPMYLRAGLTQDFALTFNFRWISDFVRKMWFESLLVNLFLWLAMLVVLPLGCLLFCYGFWLAWAMMVVASGHLNWQLYELYLTRGGEPIPLRSVPD